MDPQCLSWFVLNHPWQKSGMFWNLDPFQINMLRSSPHKKLEINHQTFQFNHRFPGSKLEENSNDKTQRRPAPTKTGRFWIIFAADTKSPGSSRVHLGCINLIPYSLSVEGITYITQGWLVLCPFFAAGPPMCCWLKHPRHCWITAGSPPMSVAPLPLFGERHLLQVTQGICISFTVFHAEKWGASRLSHQRWTIVRPELVWQPLCCFPWPGRWPMCHWLPATKGRNSAGIRLIKNTP